MAKSYAKKSFSMQLNSEFKLKAALIALGHPNNFKIVK
jgi:hypothetical protein